MFNFNTSSQHFDENACLQALIGTQVTEIKQQECQFQGIKKNLNPQSLQKVKRALYNNGEIEKLKKYYKQKPGFFHQLCVKITECCKLCIFNSSEKISNRAFENTLREYCEHRVAIFQANAKTAEGVFQKIIQFSVSSELKIALPSPVLAELFKQEKVLSQQEIEALIQGILDQNFAKNKSTLLSLNESHSHPLEEEELEDFINNEREVLEKAILTPLQEKVFIEKIIPNYTLNVNQGRMRHALWGYFAQLEPTVPPSLQSQNTHEPSTQEERHRQQKQIQESQELKKCFDKIKTEIEKELLQFINDDCAQYNDKKQLHDPQYWLFKIDTCYAKTFSQNQKNMETAVQQYFTMRERSMSPDQKNPPRLAKKKLVKIQQKQNPTEDLNRVKEQIQKELLQRIKRDPIRSNDQNQVLTVESWLGVVHESYINIKIKNENWFYPSDEKEPEVELQLPLQFFKIPNTDSKPSSIKSVTED